MSNCRSLLPPNRTAREIALEAAGCARLNNIPLPVKDLMNAENCPVDLLNILADTMSVDYWDSEWPEATKRAIIKASLSVHWHKGTDGAVLDALETLGVTAEVVHWWQTNPQGQRGTMQITAYANQNLNNSETFLNPTLISQIRAFIKHAKRGCIHASVRVGAKFSNSLGLANAMTCLKVNINEGKAVGINPAFKNQLTINNAFTAIKISRADMRAVL